MDQCFWSAFRERQLEKKLLMLGAVSANRKRRLGAQRDHQSSAALKGRRRILRASISISDQTDDFYFVSSVPFLGFSTQH